MAGLTDGIDIDGQANATLGRNERPAPTAAGATMATSVAPRR